MGIVTCIITMYLPLVILSIIKKRIKDYDIGELSIMICGLMMGTLAIITMNVNPLYNTGWLVRVLMITYIIIYIKVITRMMAALKQLFENTIR